MKHTDHRKFLHRSVDRWADKLEKAYAEGNLQGFNWLVVMEALCKRVASEFTETRPLHPRKHKADVQAVERIINYSITEYIY